MSRSRKKTNRKISFFPISLGLIVLAFRIINTNGTLYAQGSVLKAVLDASKSIVSITSEAGGIFGDRPQGAFDKSTGQILIFRKISPVYVSRTGAGFFIDSSGIIVTNAHTVQQAGRIKVVLHDGTQLIGSLIHLVPAMDLAYLQISLPNPIPPVILSDSDRSKLGDSVYTIGNSPVIKGSISGGQINGIGTSKTTPPEIAAGTALFQINFRLYKGDSGCPVFNQRGEVIGLISAQAAQGNLTYAIPSNLIRKGYREYLEKQSAPSDQK
ncbi:MAG TPA: S1C family serine protease [Candidatus Omnitrophota bacterium]|nr:S1C family serine protease [Candidatus Omnitrophota bacterium]